MQHGARFCENDEDYENGTSGGATSGRYYDLRPRTSQNIKIIFFPMNIYRNSLRCAFMATAFFLSLFAVTVRAAAADDDIGQSAGYVVVPSGTSATEVQDAIVMALGGRGWGVKSNAGDRVVAYLKHRSNEAQLTLVYSTSKIDIFCLGWEINKNTGARGKPEIPKGWIKNLQSDITKTLSRTVTNK